MMSNLSFVEVRERNDDLPPALVILWKVSGNHLSQPHNVPNLLLLQLNVGVKHCHLIALVESQSVALCLLIVHNVVQRLLIHRKIFLL